MPSTVLGDSRWNDDQGWVAREATGGGALVVGKPVLLDGGMTPLRGRLFGVAPLRHMISVAGNRSGKGVSLIIPNLLCYRGSAVVVDPKGENAWVTAQQRRSWPGAKTFILDPFGEVNRAYGDAAGVCEQTVRYNPLSILDPQSPNFADDVSYLAEALIITQGKEPYFDDTARELVAGLIAYVVESPALRPEASLGLVRAMVSMPEDGIRGLAKDAQKLGGSSLAARKLAQFTGGDKEGAAGALPTSLLSVISSAKTQTAFLDGGPLVENLAGSDFSFDELLSGTATIYLVLPVDKLDTYGRWLRLMVSVAIRTIARGPKGKVGDRLPVLFMLDEFGTIGKLPAVARAAGLMAGFGMILWIIVQDLNQLKHDYEEQWQTFVGNAEMLTFFGGIMDEFTTEHLSKMIGMTTIEYSTLSETTGTSGSTGASASGSGGANSNWNKGWSESVTTAHHIQQRALLLPDQVRRLRGDLCVAVGRSYPIVCRRIVYYEDYPFCLMARPLPAYGPLDDQRKRAVWRAAVQEVQTVEDAKSYLAAAGLLELRQNEKGAYVASSIKCRVAVLRTEEELIRWARAFVATLLRAGDEVPREIGLVADARRAGWEVARLSSGGVAVRHKQAGTRKFQDAAEFMSWVSKGGG